MIYIFLYGLFHFLHCFSGWILIRISVFGESHIDEVAEELGVPVIGKMPIDASLAEAVENENFAEVSNDYLAEAVNKL